MTTTHFAEGNHAAEFLVSESDQPTYSRKLITLAEGNNLLAGAVLGRVITAGTATAQAGTNTGNGAMGSITVGAGAQPGGYLLKITKKVTDKGDFQLIDPQGDVCGVGSVATAFSGGGLSFTLADGTADFEVGDQFIITVTALTEKWHVLAPAATNGSQIAAGVLYRDSDATDGDIEAVAIVRSAIVKLAKLVWPAGITDAQKATAIAQLEQGAGILVRS